jgi:hypothetical protein
MNNVSRYFLVNLKYCYNIILRFVYCDFFSCYITIVVVSIIIIIIIVLVIVIAIVIFIIIIVTLIRERRLSSLARHFCTCIYEPECWMHVNDLAYNINIL